MALSDEKKETIKSLLATGASKNEVAKRCNVSWSTVDVLSKEEPDKIESIREHKRVDFIGRLWESMDSALRLADKRIQLAMDANKRLDELYDEINDSGLDPKKAFELQKTIESITNVPLGQISTFIGTIYDKHALMTGGKTSEVGVTIQDDIP